MSVRHASRSVIDALAPCRTSNYVCRQCRRNRQFPQVVVQQRGYASQGPEGLPFAERVRRKLWKGTPPGPANVDELYGGPGALETMYKERRERKLRSKPLRDATPSQSAADAQSETPLSKIVETEEHQDVSAQVETPGLAKKDAEESLSYRDEQPGYKPATTWDGLGFLGHTGHWKEMPVRQQDEYSRWLESPVQPAWTYNELVSLMHQAIIECYSCKQSGVVLPKKSRLAARSLISQDRLEAATIEISSAGKINGSNGVEQISVNDVEPFLARTEPEQQPEKKYTFAEEQTILERTEPEMIPLEPRLLYTPSSTSFVDAGLDLEDKTTFAILKRFAVLTNHTIPDPMLSDFASGDPAKNTVRAFLNALVEHIKPKPANLAQQLLEDPLLADQSNLLILGRRETPVDKEKELGRWKVIEEELKARGLPVLGRA